jgi:hypothetical protein
MTRTVWPAVTTDAAFWSVQNGLLGEPGPLSEQLVVPTHSVVVAALAGVPLNTAQAATSTRPAANAAALVTRVRLLEPHIPVPRGAR